MMKKNIDNKGGPSQLAGVGERSEQEAYIRLPIARVTSNFKNFVLQLSILFFAFNVFHNKITAEETPPAPTEKSDEQSISKLVKQLSPKLCEFYPDLENELKQDNQAWVKFFLRTDEERLDNSISDTDRELLGLKALKNLQGVDDETIKKVFTVIIYRHVKKLLPDVVALLEDENATVRKFAVNVLSELDSYENIPKLIVLLKDKNKKVRWFTVSALLKLKARESIPALMECLKNEKEDEENSWYPVRALTVEALGELGAKVAIPELIACLKDVNSTVHVAAIEALATMQTRDAIPDIVRLLKKKNLFYYIKLALLELDAKESIPDLLVYLKNKNESEETRWTAADLLGLFDAKQAIPELIVSLKDESWMVRCQASEALGRLSAKEAIPALRACLKDANECVRQNAAMVLGLLRDKESVSNIAEILKEADFHTHLAATEALGNIGSNDAIPALINSIRNEIQINEDRMARGAATLALGKINSKEVLPELIAFMNDDSLRVGDYAASALGSVGDKSTIPALIECLKNHKYAKASAAEALGELGAKEAIPVLMDSMVDEGGSECYSAMRALVKLNAKEAIPKLIIHLKNKYENARFEAVIALGQLNAKEAIPELLRLSKSDPENRVRVFSGAVLICMGEKVDLPDLTEFLDESDDLIKIKTCDMLVRLKMKSAIPKIRRLRGDLYENVRQAAKAALEKLQALPDANALKTETK